MWKKIMLIAIIIIAGLGVYEYGKYNADLSYTSFIDMRYNYALSSAINGVSNFDKALSENSTYIDNVANQCSNLINEVAIITLMREPHYNIYSNNTAISMKTISDHFRQYSNIIVENDFSSNTNLENELLISKIKNDLITIQKADIFNAKDRSFENLKQRWNSLSKTLEFKPLSPL